MTDTNIISIILAVVSYLMIGFIFETHGPSGKFDARTLLFWPFGIDIQIHYWLELRRIEREGKQQLVAVAAERNRTLKVLEVRWAIPADEIEVTITHRGEISTWCGSGTVWHKVPDGERASTWLESWLCDRWTAARREKT